MEAVMSMAPTVVVVVIGTATHVKSNSRRPDSKINRKSEDRETTVPWRQLCSDATGFCESSPTRTAQPCIRITLL